MVCAGMQCFFFFFFLFFFVIVVVIFLLREARHGPVGILLVFALKKGELFINKIGNITVIPMSFIQ